MREYHLTEHSRQVTSTGILFIGSISNGSFAGLDNKAAKFIQDLLNDRILKNNEASEVNKGIIQTLKSFNIFECANVSSREVTSNEPHTAYLHLTNMCNYSCYGCYSNDSSRNRKADLSPIEVKRILNNI